MSTQKSNQSVKLTKSVVDRLEPPEKGQRFIRDCAMPGFGVRITATGVRSFIVEKRINGKVRRFTLGRYGPLTVQEARDMAHEKLGDAQRHGIDPVVERRKAKAHRFTLGQAYADFCKARKHLKPTTRRDYDRIMNEVLADWQAKPLLDITRNMVARRHRQLGETRGPYYANLAMRTLRSVLSFAKATYDDGDGQPLLANNPVAVLSETRAWYRQERRQTVIKEHQLPAWYEAVQALRAPAAEPTARTVGDYLLLLLFTGLRAREGLTLQWSQIDLTSRTLTLPDPKNRQPLSLPLSDFVHGLLEARWATAVNGYVFPGRDGRSHLVEPKKRVRWVAETSGVPFTLHDLRRTFVTTAESLEIAPYAIKRLVNHKMSGDVTAGYIVSDVDRLRAPAQKITNALTTSINADERVVVPFGAFKAVE